MTESIMLIFNLKDVKINNKEEKTHISGQPQSVKRDIFDRIQSADLKDFSKCDDSHLLRVIRGENDPKQESDYISISTGYDISVGVRDENGRISQLGDTRGVESFRGDCTLKASAKVVQHTEKGKTKYYLAIYPQVIVLPPDWKEYLFDPFDGM